MLSHNHSLVSDKHPLLSLLLIMTMVAIAFGFLGPLIGLLIASSFYDGPIITEMLNPHPSPELFLPLMVVQGITTLLGLIVVPMLFVRFVEQRPVARFFSVEKDVRVYLALLVLAIGFMISVSPIVEWNAHVVFPDFMKDFGDWARQREDDLAGVTQLLTGFTSPAQFIIGLVVIAVLPALGEEFVFRGLIQNELFRNSRNIHLAVWTSAMLFSAIHMQFYGFVPRMMLGAFFGYLYYWSGNLSIPVLAHFLHNGLTLTSLYLYNTGASALDPNEEESAPGALVIAASVVTFALLYFLYRTFTKKTSTPPST